MKSSILKDIINENIQSIIFEKFLRQKIREAITEVVNNINEKQDTTTDGANMEIKRNTVMKLLKNDKLTNSKFAYDIWHPKDQSEKDTARSLFSKKVNGTPDADGNVRQFTDAEISKLYELLRGV